MSQSKFLDFSSRNDRINIRLENFHFFHRPITAEEDEAADGKYIEQANATHQLYNWIHHNGADSGTYLVTGYRGAGKSSFVGTLIRKLKAEGNYLSLSVNFGQENLEEQEILRIIAKRLYGLLMEKHGELYEDFKMRCRWSDFFKFIALACFSLFLFHLKDGWHHIYALCAFLFFVMHIILSAIKPSCLIRAIRKLEELTERLHASVETEDMQETAVGGVQGIKAWGMRFGKKLNKTPATIQEIEYELTEALDLLEEENPRRKIIIVFDELDKTDSSGRRMQANELPEFEKLSIRPGEKISSRARKEEVLRMIANMKFFLSSAKACFIFIAGREMYEAFQADMSDRDFSINSIFNGVININSFLSSSRKTNSSTQKTEEFVCRQLLPNDFRAISVQSCYPRYDSQPLYSLRNYYNYAIHTGNDFYEDEITADGKPDREARKRRIWKQVMALYRFVNYLTYISNGSPKKLTLFFEKNVRQGTYLAREKKTNFAHYYRNGKMQPLGPEEKKAFYLSFGYYTQIKINFIHYLTYPIMQNLINRSNMYGDKLQVSASFLISHLFKLHNCGFSWRNLEQVPELLEINKTPEMREYIGSVIDLMNHTLLTTIPFGLYHYKFPMRISEEISFHSKLSGEVSAMFNFSQEDIRGIKEHYLRLLGSGGATNESTRYAQASVYHTIGDLCMMEENYSNAILEYEKSLEIISPVIEELKKGSNTIQGRNYIAFLNRTMLKLGLAHEKRRTDTSAFILYTELLQTLVELSKRCNGLLENIRNMHLVLLARLYALEKINMAGICRKDLEDACLLFNGLFQVGNNGNNSLVKADFFRKLGDILYYKNDKFPLISCRNDPSVLFHDAKSCYQVSLRSLLGNHVYSCCNDNVNCRQFCSASLQIKEEMKQNNRCSGNSSYEYRDNFIYHLALCLENMGHVSVSEYEGPYDLNSNFIQDFSNAIEASDTHLNVTTYNNMERALLYYWTASRLYNISCERGLSTICYKEMAYVVLTLLRNRRENSSVSASALLGLYRNLTKHFFISQYRQYEHVHLSESDIMQWMQHFEMFQPARLTDLSGFPDLEELLYTCYTFKLTLYPLVKQEERRKIISSLATFYTSDIMTGKHSRCTLTSTVQNLKLKSRFNEHLLCKLLNCDAGDLETLQFADIADYVYGKVDDELVLEIFYKGKEADQGIPSKLDLLEFLITDGMFCLSRVLEFVIPLRNTTLFNHSFKADIYMHLIRFNALYRLLYCYYYYGENKEYDPLIKTYLGDRERFRCSPRNVKQHVIRSLRPAGNFSTRRLALFLKAKEATRKISPTHTHIHFLAERAIHHYTQVRQIHCQGKSYQELIHNLFFLEDDLKNDTLQFYMAMERFELAAKSQESIENRLKQMYSDNIAYQMDNYISD